MGLLSLDRIDDALHATRAAVAGGYLPGGGTAILKCVHELVDDLGDKPIPPGLQLLREACEKPIKQIAANRGVVPELVCEKVKDNEKFTFGFNARENNYCDLIKAGIIDPTLVVTSALRSAVSAADNLLSVSCCLTIFNE